MKRVALLFLDLLLIACATIFAVLLRDNLELRDPDLQAILPYLVVTLLSGAVVFSIAGVSSSVWRSSAQNDYLRLVVASVATVLISLAISFSITRLEGIARAVPVLQLMTMIFLLMAARLLIRLRHHHRFRPSQLVREPLASNQTTVLVFGTTRITELYLRSVAEFERDEISIAGLISRTEAKVGRRFLGSKILGTSDDLMEILSDLEIHGVKVDKICVSTPFRALTARELHQLTAAELGTDIEIVYLEEAIFFAATGSREERGPVTVEPRSDDLSFKISEDQLDDYARRPFWRVKRVFDVVLAASLACLFSPFIFCVAILAAVDVGLPVVFWQQRPGVGGHPFRVYKFRTMAAAHDADGHRVNDEARSSAVGRFLRRTRLDELPQLYNILIGDMSFVGPRPLLPGDQPIGSAVRTLIRPGLTGWAQINGGRDVTPADKVALDVWYLQNASLTLDVKIFARTALMVMFGEQVNRRAIRQAWSDLCATGVCSKVDLGDLLKLRSAPARDLKSVRVA